MIKARSRKKEKASPFGEAFSFRFGDLTDATACLAWIFLSRV